MPDTDFIVVKDSLNLIHLVGRTYRNANQSFTLTGTPINLR